MNLLLSLRVMLEVWVFRIVVVTLGFQAARDDADLALRRDLAAAIVTVTRDPNEQDLLASIAWHESHFDREVVTCRRVGAAGDRTAWQIVTRNLAELLLLCRSLEDDAAIALERVRESLRACRELPPPERLAVYARGRCSSEEGRRLSRVRWFRSGGSGS